MLHNISFIPSCLSPGQPLKLAPPAGSKHNKEQQPASETTVGGLIKDWFAVKLQP